MAFRKLARVWIVLAVVPIVPIGCKRTSGTAPAPSASQAAPSPQIRGTDPALLKELADLTKVCQVDVNEGNLNCAQGEQRKLISEFVANQRSRTAAVATFAQALARENPPTKAVAAHVLYAAFRSPWGPDAKPGSVNPEDAEALLSAALQAPKNLARQAIPAAVHASMLANRTEALYGALDKTPNSDVRTNGVRYLMTHGRLAALPKIQELAKDANVAVVLAALDSPRNMYSWTSAEQASICPWAASMLGDERPAIAAKAASLLGNCSGKYLDQLLENGEAALAAGKFNATQLTSYRDLCPPERRGPPTGPSQEQCARCRKLLEKVVEGKQVDEQTRSSTLIALAFQWPDEATLKLAKRLSKGKEKSLAEHATRTVERLEQRKGLEQKAKAKAK